MISGPDILVHKSVADRVLSHLKGYLDASDRSDETLILKVMDAGCGTGRAAEVLGVELERSREKFQYEFHGLDYSSGMLEVARAKTELYEDLVQGDLTKKLYMYEDESFDVVVSVGTFLQGHVGPEAISELCRVVKKNGLLIFSVRPQFFDDHEEEFLSSLSEGSMDVLGIDSMWYTSDMKAPIVSSRKTGGLPGVPVWYPNTARAGA